MVQRVDGRDEQRDEQFGRAEGVVPARGEREDLGRAGARAHVGCDVGAQAHAHDVRGAVVGVLRDEVEEQRTRVLDGEGGYRDGLAVGGEVWDQEMVTCSFDWDDRFFEFDAAAAGAVDEEDGFIALGVVGLVEELGAGGVGGAGGCHVGLLGPPFGIMVSRSKTQYI